MLDRGREEDVLFLTSFKKKKKKKKKKKEKKREKSIIMSDFFQVDNRPIYALDLLLLRVSTVEMIRQRRKF